MLQSEQKEAPKIRHAKKRRIKAIQKHGYITWFFYNLKAFLAFTSTEVKQLLVVSLISAFVFTFNKWGTVTFDLERGLANFFLAAIFMTMFLFANMIVKKSVAIWQGYDTEYHWSVYGIIVMVVLAFLSYGFLPLILPGWTEVKHNTRRRIGTWRYFFKHIDHHKIYLLSYLFNYLIIILILAPIYIFTASRFVYLLITYNVAIVFYSMLPLPQNDGLLLFFTSRANYLTAFAFIIAMSVLVMIAKVYSFVIAAILGILLARAIVLNMDDYAAATK